ncbi:MAG: DNA-directed RNA polymerase subunit beta' [Candidatus Phytoplasma stylosanthis]|uniref:DNA-directed RNA polymerase subunit beta' n=1 Tax=Candidatus Phytoplasma stylosanthis TaxID=2798314 RepID=UPI002939C02A|nr:DNA-directed RNA polymerase subunit beta' [Candidatus Phytoplasma stylosanthis]MDV3167793.1 DNA-directed RNA polymerase subunit beta' [Candidatus Phytoplasma stylosanthis]MDV3170930.1 DNA-directed RNA polymerase subunit beta' [Candidatus Phytoplasma stylosanthis]MDV3173576.1 DNA-directed RNA polymerase subunit beta' [Candidatus Phytoplasma stylosanthis]MDV3174352.1 DNA-directed RNA polymerase subunit beta' [Candidatus Phytoplasma stylosanthis]MDV3202378.1 DNA-directed RNA polymerase subunit
MNLNIKIEDLLISDSTLKSLHSIEINFLKDFNSYNLKELKSLLNEDCFLEIIPILKKYYLPESLENLDLEPNTIPILLENKIINCRVLLETDLDFLFHLFENKNPIYYKSIENLFYLYNYESKEDKKDKKNIQEDTFFAKSPSKMFFSDKKYGSREYEYFKIRLASPHEIRQWSYGEIVNYETINYRTAKPEFGGLFCPRIFGPSKDLTCSCVKKQTLKLFEICPKCGVEITEQKVRRERMGHIELASPVVHTWYLNSSPSRLSVLLGIKTKELLEIVYYASYIVISPGSTKLEKKQIISEMEYGNYLDEYGDTFEALTGAEAIKKLLEQIDLDAKILELRKILKHISKQKRDNVIKRLEILISFNQSDNKPEWMVLDVLPVLPADLRPIVPLDGGRFATTDINDLYRRILNRNNRLKKQIKQKAPRLIIKNEKRMLQESVDVLFDNVKMNKKTNFNIEKSKVLKSLSEMLRGKQGRFRQNLLGKRVDYSGRSVIIVGPELKIHQCGLPRIMAVILFKPFILNKLQEKKGIDKKNATSLYDKMDEYVFNILEEVVKEHPVLLNRAPTLHRLGIQAFEPKLIDGKAIKLHPLVTPAFNADFDGDQMAVYLPLSLEAQAEARLLMLISNNILDPKNGNPVLFPSQDMVLGNYYLTIEEKKDRLLEGFDYVSRTKEHKYKHRNEGKIFFDLKEAELSFYNKEIHLHTKILVKTNNINSYFTSEQKDKYLVTTLGKLIFNNILPSDFPYIQEPTISNLENKVPDHYFISKGQDPKKYLSESLYIEPFKKRFLSMIIDRVFKKSNITETSKMLDNIKDLGFKYSTIAGITISHSDINIYSKKDELLKETEDKIIKIENFYDTGFLTVSEKKSLVIQEWKNVREKIQEGLMTEFHKDNNLFMISDSGARGNTSNFSQLSGMRGLMNSPKGEILEIPVKSSFKEGLTVSEFFISTHGARKVSTDTALKTAESGYLTRRLIDVAQDKIITQEDCNSDKGVYIKAIERDGKEIISLSQRIFSRYSSEDIFHPEKKEIIVKKNELLSQSIIDKIVSLGIKQVKIRSILHCNTEFGICKKCYGLNLANNKKVEIGEAVGVIAAQSIGEPGTQLTMRTFHTGGVLSVSDITQGLPRIQELFEARKPKGKAIINEYDGIVKEIQDINSYSPKIVIIPDYDPTKIHIYSISFNAEILVKENEKVYIGQQLTTGSIDLRELLRITDVQETQKYILEEVQKVYQSQSVSISDKHIEIIISQMFKQLLIIYEGDTSFLPGTEVSIKEFKKVNLQMIEQNKKMAVGRPILLGITRSSLRSDSFLSAASFQETTKILIDAAIKGQTDYLYGLKENVIVGGLIPAGTGILNSKEFNYPLKKEDK